MDILVSDLAKLFGLSNQTLHYYEEKNILTPKRNVMNGYRYYEASDLSLLGSIKKYRNAKFSLNETMELCDNSNEWDIISKYHNQKKLLWREIEEKQYIINQIDEDLSLYMRYKEIGNTIVIENLEGFLRFESTDREIIFQNQKMRKEATPWFKNIFHTCASEMFYIDRKSKKILNGTYGMLVTIPTAKFLNLTLTENVEKIKGGNFVTSTINTNYDIDIEKALFDCIDYIDNNNLTMRGVPFTKTIFVYKNNTVYKALKQILIPI